MSDVCPKCGAEVRRNTYPFSSSMVPATEWLCGTYDKWMNGVCVGTNQSEQCLRNQLATVTAERDHLKAADNPEWDCTDCAHPAWWRGHEHTAKSMCQIINEILDGEDDGRGVANEPWESTRQRIRGMAVRLAAAEQRVRELEDATKKTFPRSMMNAMRDYVEGYGREIFIGDNAANESATFRDGMHHMHKFVLRLGSQLGYVDSQEAAQAGE